MEVREAGRPLAKPVLGRTEEVRPISGKIFVILNGTLIPLSTKAGLTTGTTIDALQGTLQLTTATGKGLATQTGTFGGAVFKATQTRSGPLKGLTTLTLVNNAFQGAPSFASCTAQSGAGGSAAAASTKVLQLLHAKDNHGKFRTKGRYAAATTRGTVWSIADAATEPSHTSTRARSWSTTSYGTTSRSTLAAATSPRPASRAHGRIGRTQLRPGISVRAIDPAADDGTRLRCRRGPVGVRDRIVRLADHGRAAAVALGLPTERRTLLDEEGSDDDRRPRGAGAGAVGLRGEEGVGDVVGRHAVDDGDARLVSQRRSRRHLPGARRRRFREGRAERPHPGALGSGAAVEAAGGRQDGRRHLLRARGHAGPRQGRGARLCGGDRPGAAHVDRLDRVQAHPHRRRSSRQAASATPGSPTSTPT